MATPITIYKFAEFTLNPAKRMLLRNGKEISLVKRDFEVLLLLIENHPQLLSKDEIIKSVWGNTSDSSVEKVISSLRQSLGDTATNSRFIKTVSKKGYGFIHDVVETTENVTTPTFEKSILQKSFSRNLTYILTASLLYGVLFWIALLLEIAYQFDRFGKTAIWLGFPIILWIFFTSFAGLALTENLVRQEKHNALFIGMAFFLGGTILVSLAMLDFLPNTPITFANFQTQPAFAAFLKNSLIYFLPLGVIFILIPFHFICVQQIELSKITSFSKKPDLSLSGKGTINLRPSFLFGLWLFAVAYSIASTFYLLDNLLPGQFHSLFVSLIFIRFFVYFTLGLGCLIWYKSQRLSK